MFVVVNPYFLTKKFDGIVFWPFILIRRKALENNRVFMNHERIHIQQQQELLVLPFFVWYVFEYFFRLAQTGNSYKAYKKISFEREAYSNEKNFKYLKERKYWSFVRYL